MNILRFSAFTALLIFCFMPLCSVTALLAQSAPSAQTSALPTNLLPQYQLQDLGPSSATGTFYSPVPVPAIAQGNFLDWDLYDQSFHPHAYTWSPALGSVDITASSPAGTGVVSAVNAAGQVAGELLGLNASLTLTPQSAFLWTPGTTLQQSTRQNLGTLGYGSGEYALAVALNRSGQVAGSSIDAQNNSRGFVWTPGGTDGMPSNPQMKDLSLLNPAFTNAIGINDAGEVVSSNMGLLYANGQVIAIPGLDAEDPASGGISLLGINDMGQVFGQGYIDYESTGFLWTPETPHGTVGHLASIGSSPNVDGGLTALALNNAGQIAGYGLLQGNVYAGTHGFLWTPNAAFTGGTRQDVGSLGMNPSFVSNGNDSSNELYLGYTSQCNALNDAGTVVGYATAAAQSAGTPALPPQNHGFVFAQGFMYDLNSLLTRSLLTRPRTPPSLVVVNATGISADGSIAALAKDAGGVTHTVLLTPKPPVFHRSYPSIVVLNPGTALQYSPGFTLYVTGSDFTPQSLVAWNGTLLPTKALSNTLLSATVPASALAVSGPAAITVSSGAAQSPAASFQVNAGGEPAPSCLSFSPTMLYAGPVRPQSVTLTGSGFFADTMVTWGNDSYPVFGISADHTQAYIVLPASALAYPSQNGFLLSSPPGVVGYRTSSVLQVLPRAPVVSSITPSQVPAGAGTFITITGRDFYFTGSSNAPGTTVSINGGEAFVTIVSSTKMTAFLYSDLTQTPGPTPIVVSNGPPGGGSITQMLTVVVPPPAITSLNPATITAGNPYAQYITITGSGFYDGTQVTGNGQALPIYNLSSTQMTVQTVPSLFVAPQNAQITVTNLGPAGQGGSATAVLPVVPPGGTATGGTATGVSECNSPGLPRH